MTSLDQVLNVLTAMMQELFKVGISCLPDNYQRNSIHTEWHTCETAFSTHARKEDSLGTYMTPLMNNISAIDLIAVCWDPKDIHECARVCVVYQYGVAIHRNTHGQNMYNYI